MMPTQWPVTHQWPGSQWKQIQVPTAQLAPSMSATVPAVSLECRKMSLRKVDQLTFNT